MYIYRTRIVSKCASRFVCAPIVSNSLYCLKQSLHFSSFLYNMLLIVVSIYLKKSAPWTQPYDCLFSIVNTCGRKPLCSFSLLQHATFSTSKSNHYFALCWRSSVGRNVTKCLFFVRLANSAILRSIFKLARNLFSL